MSEYARQQVQLIDEISQLEAKTTEKRIKLGLYAVAEKLEKRSYFLTSQLPGFPLDTPKEWLEELGLKLEPFDTQVYVFARSNRNGDVIGNWHGRYDDDQNGQISIKGSYHLRNIQIEYKTCRSGGCFANGHAQTTLLKYTKIN